MPRLAVLLLEGGGAEWQDKDGSRSAHPTRSDRLKTVTVKSWKTFVEDYVIAGTIKRTFVPSSRYLSCNVARTSRIAEVCLN